MAAHPGCNLGLAEPVGGFKLPQKLSLLEDIKLPGAVSGKKLKESVLFATGPDLGLQCVPAHTPGRSDPLIPIDEDKAGRRAFYHHDGQKLSAAQKRIGKTYDLSRSPYAGVGIKHVQMDNFDRGYGDANGHDFRVADASGKVPRVISLQDCA